MEKISITNQIVDELVKAGRDPKDLTIAYAGFYFRHLYMEWLALKNAYSYEKANQLYQEATWCHPQFSLGLAFKAFVEAKNLETKDLESFARAISEQWKVFPIRLDVTKISDEEVVMENPTGFCPNPGFGPREWDRYIDRVEYANVDGWQGTQNCMIDPSTGYFAVCGVKDKYEFEMLGAVCTGYPTCKWVIRKKKKDKNN